MKRGLTTNTDIIRRIYRIQDDKTVYYEGQKASEITLEKIKNNRANQIFPYKDASIEPIIQNELTTLGIQFEKHKPFRIRDFYH
jgi:hypothetical protein